MAGRWPPCYGPDRIYLHKQPGRTARVQDSPVGKIAFEHSTRALMRRLLGDHVRPHWRRLALAGLCMVLGAAATAALAQLMEPIIDGVFVNRDASMLAWVSTAVLATFFVKGMATYGQAMLMSYVGQRIIADLQVDLYARLIRADLATFHATPSGTLVSRLVNDVGMMRGTVSVTLTSIGKDTLTLALLIVLLPSVWTVFLSGQRYLTQMQERSGAASDVRLSLKGVADEIQEAIRLVHPQPGATTSEGVGFVSASGGVVFYFVDQRLAEGQRVLWRQDLVGGELLAVARNVKHFRATVPAVEPGIEPAFVNLDLSVLAPGAERDFNAITGVFLRAVELEVPE